MQSINSPPFLSPTPRISSSPVFVFYFDSYSSAEGSGWLQVEMKMSCNGCRVLRKGCSDSCSIRPCLQWIKSPESQANATVFLAKFYGRAGLLNLISAGPDHLRPAIFRSLLYEACGRIVNPIYGSVGLLWSCNWQACQAAVDAVLRGAPVVPIPTETAASAPAPPLKAYDIRHVSKDPAGDSLHKVNALGRARFKRHGVQPAPAPQQQHRPPAQFRRARSHESTSSSRAAEPEPQTNESISSAGTAEAASHVSQGEPELSSSSSEALLELTLGFKPSLIIPQSTTSKPLAASSADFGLAPPATATSFPDGPK
ncbi:LOB domain-containing protein 42-like [Curcuma longa]|uniref:LOB domain-containing protein 42-like n=1 Tax=Curcuma longa TaxID=136217 RepID=UPI003D9DB53E